MLGISPKAFSPTPFILDIKQHACVLGTHIKGGLGAASRSSSRMGDPLAYHCALRAPQYHDFFFGARSCC